MSAMDHQPSEYLEYLPPFFREAAGDGHAPGAFLSELLLGFQKILTGVKNQELMEDEIPIKDRSRTRIYEPLEAVIDQLDRLFDPFRTDPRFLEWLASWVALELVPDWTDAEQRKMIARMVQISRRIGLKAGLYDYLDIYARESLRPRVSIDDSEAVVRVVLRDDGPPQVNVLAFAQVFEPKGVDVQLMPFARQKSEITSPGNNLLIVASIKEQPNSNAELYIRFRDRAGKTVDKEEKDLSSKAEELKKLRKLLSHLWGVDPLPRALKDSVIIAVRAIVGEIPATLKTPILYRPSAIAVMTGGKPDQVRYVVADGGLPGKSYPPPLQPSLWLLKPNGELDAIHWSHQDGDTMRIPRPINQEQGTKNEVDSSDKKKRELTEPVLVEPVAVVVEDQNNILVLERGHTYSRTGAKDLVAKPCVFRYTRVTPTPNDATPVTFQRTRLILLDGSDPIDMVLYPEGKDSTLAILEQEVKADGTKGVFRLRIVKFDGKKPTDTPSLIVLADPKNQVPAPITPTAIAYESPGSWIIADARDGSNMPKMGAPGTLFRVQTDPNPRLKNLLPDDPQRNPLVRPTGLVVFDKGDFVVCDRGVKTAFYKEKSYSRWMAEPANLFRVKWPKDPQGSPGVPVSPTIHRLTTRGLLSWPAKVAVEPSGAILVAEQGERDPNLFEGMPESNDVVLSWRGKPHRFGVSVLFTGPRLDDLTTTLKLTESRILYGAKRSIESVIEQYKPLHSIHIWKSY